MKTKLVKIGRSQGVRIPKALIKGAHLNGSIEMELRGNEIIVRDASRRANGRRATKSHSRSSKDRHIDHEWLDAPLIGDSELPAW